MGEKISEYKFLARECEGKIPLGRFSFRCEAKIQMDIEEIGFEGVGLIHVEYGTDRGGGTFVKAVFNLRVLCKFMKLWSS